MKKTFGALLFACLLLFSACSQVKTTPTEDLNAFFGHMQKGHYAQADTYIRGEDDERFLEDLESFDNQDSLFVQKIQSFTYEILEEKEIDKNTSELRVKATYPNMIEPFSAVMTKLSLLVLTDPSIQRMTDEQINEEVSKLLSIATRDMEEEIIDAEHEFTVTMHKGQTVWEADIENDELIRTLTGGLYQTEKEEDATAPETTEAIETENSEQ